ncbi:MAG: GNAT family N-acetyltransferase [Bacteriovoracaceae bacterium]|jgi:ribosomal protein S18 acetylase RimI-like enzyme|nr:GNAT family N-acetyltransferase [Halobacteriovoraceae bacterium]MDP7321214.1 GNAT family N-acetyltransferase [Bacteriovoracaceae bacterium]|tara:strand:- start:159 stop:620 length:462 start_codon:yes stop_codon:yes gene_type:complete
MNIELKIMEFGDRAVCENILRSLPTWFGIETAIIDYVNTSYKIPMIIAYYDKKAIGFVSLKIHNSFSAEVYVMGVDERYHGNGVGRKLLTAVENYLRDKGLEFLQVKTLAQERECNAYAKTRLFYKSYGFKELEVFPDFWDKDNPCLLMIKNI